MSYANMMYGWRLPLLGLCATLGMAAAAVPAQAVSLWGTSAAGELTGSRTSTLDPSGGISATSVWADGGYSVNWIITHDINTGQWTYNYNFITASKDISHAIVEVTQDDSDFNLYFGSDSFGDATTYSPTDPGNSNPLLPNPLYGIKYDVSESEDGTDLFLTIVTDRAPVYGVFYAKGGKTDGTPMVAWATALDESDYKTNTTLTTTDFIVRPNGSVTQDDPEDPGDAPPPPTSAVPEPATAAMAAMGLLAMLGGRGLRRRR